MATTDEAMPGGDGEAASFGFRDIPLQDKQGLVDDVFDRVANRYDLMNDLMSGGLHRVWKGAFVSWLSPPRTGSRAWRVLDLAGGTGDIALRIARRSESARIVVGDINASMLEEGRRRFADRPFADRVDFREMNAEALPEPDGVYDAVTIAFGIRNVPRIGKALAEAHRVLKPGGRFMCLEFSTVDVAGLDRLYDLVSFQVIPRIGGLVVGDAEPYSYLVESIRRFPNQARFGAMIEDAGFARVTWRNLTGGVAAIHSGWKV